MGNYFSGNKQSSLDNIIKEDCSVNILVDKKSLNENLENNNIIGGDNQEEPVITQEEPEITQEEPDIDFVNKTPEPTPEEPTPEPSPEPTPEPMPQEPTPEEPTITGGSLAGSDIDTSVNGGDYSNDDEIENTISNTTQPKNKKRRNKKKKNNVPVI